MTDDEFWEHVLQRTGPADDDDRPDAPDDDVLVTEPCGECGAAGACAWDAEGRPLIHASESDDGRWWEALR